MSFSSIQDALYLSLRELYQEGKLQTQQKNKIENAVHAILCSHDGCGLEKIDLQIIKQKILQEYINSKNIEIARM